MPTREAVRVKFQVNEELANLAERLRDRAVELVLMKIKVLQAGEVRADAVRDGTWLIREGVVGSEESWLMSCNALTSLTHMCCGAEQSSTHMHTRPTSQTIGVQQQPLGGCSNLAQRLGDGP